MNRTAVLLIVSSLAVSSCRSPSVSLQATDDRIKRLIGEIAELDEKRSDFEERITKYAQYKGEDSTSVFPRVLGQQNSGGAAYNSYLGSRLAVLEALSNAQAELDLEVDLLRKAFWRATAP